jgi:GT2 family glycosyltransferase
MAEPKVCVIILNWNGLEDTIECLGSLEKVTYSNYQVIVVDNGSEGDDVKILRGRFGDYIHIIENDRNYGFAEGNNIGMRYALANLGPDYLLLLNNDTVVAPDFLTQLVTAAEQDSAIGVVGSRTYDYQAGSSTSLVGGRVNWWRGNTPHIRSDDIIDKGSNIREVDRIEGSCLLARREVVEKIGMLDPEYFAYWEETDWCVRIRRGGYKICCALDSKIWHKGQHSYVDSLKLHYFLRNNILFMRKNADAKHVAVFLVYFVLVSLPIYTFKPFVIHPLGTITAVGKALLWNIWH